MYDPSKDISRQDAEEGIRLVFEGYAGQFEWPEEPYIPLVMGSFQQCDPQEPLNITSRTFEAAHRFINAKGRTLGDALDDFERQARFEWPSLKNRFTIAWRKKPFIKIEVDFDTREPIFTIGARYTMILDYEPFEKKETRD